MSLSENPKTALVPSPPKKANASGIEFLSCRGTEAHDVALLGATQYLLLSEIAYSLSVQWLCLAELVKHNLLGPKSQHPPFSSPELHKHQSP